MNITVRPCLQNEGFFVATLEPIGLTALARHPARAKAFVLRDYADRLVELSNYQGHGQQAPGFTGVAKCECGGQVISNTGKMISGRAMGNIACWSCQKEWDIDFAHASRGLLQLSKENQAIWRQEVRS